MRTSSSKNGALTTGDLDKIAGLLDGRIALLASKEDLKELKIELKDYIHEGIGTVMSGVDNIAEQLAEKKQVEKLEDWAKTVGDKIGLKPNL